MNNLKMFKFTTKRALRNENSGVNLKKSVSIDWNKPNFSCLLSTFLNNLLNL